MSREWKAKLIGGPCDGQIVEILGQCYMKKMRRKNTLGKPKGFPNFFFDAIYQWSATDGDEYVGHFVGYYDGATKVDRLGRRLGMKRKKQCN